MASAVVYRQKRALIVGINDYPGDQLNYCINDATDLKTTLQRINFDVLSGENCKLTEFYHLVDQFASTIQPDDLALFYFAGHGKQNEDENYLLPSDYDYDHRGHERDYIANHAINVKYIMKKIDDRKCRITIYLFDCCRKVVKSRAMNANQGLLPMHAPLQTLIVFACAPGKEVQDETRNNRNGSFIENLKKYIATPNKDIEEIMKDVARDVNSQTGGHELPYQTSSLTDKVFLVTNNDQGHHSTAWLQTALLESNHHGTSPTDINILLLGEARVGKKTFINAFANYLTYDTFDEALRGNMEVLIPFVFSFFDPSTFEHWEIKAGTPTGNEWRNIDGESHTQVCQTYTFTVGNRLLRLIDTPSIDDTHDSFPDSKNMQHIFTYISQYKHVNSICILMKPDAYGIDNFRVRYSIEELLTHLHIHTYQNITWVFTHAGSTFYRPGSTMSIIRTLLKDITSVNFEITQKNCFLFENQPLRLLALNKDHSEFVHFYLSDTRKMWNISTTAFRDLISFTLSCKPYMVCETFFLNMARQLVYKLIELIDDKTSSGSSDAAIDGSNSTWNREKVSLRNVCDSLAQFIKTNSILPFNTEIYTYCERFLEEELAKQGVSYRYIQCLQEHSNSPFTNYTMERVNTFFCIRLEDQTENTKVSEFLKENSITPFVKYLQIYIRNSYKTKLNQQMSNAQFLQYVRESSNFSSSNQSTKYLCSMFYEELVKQTNSVEYLEFLQENSMVPLNENMIELICQLIFEQIEWNSDNFDSKTIRLLENLISNYHYLEKLLTVNLNEQRAFFDVNVMKVSQMKDILQLLDELCTLPVNGMDIRRYMEDLEKTQRDMIRQEENVVRLPARAQSSALMQQLRAIIERQQS